MGIREQATKQKYQVGQQVYVNHAWRDGGIYTGGRITLETISSINKDGMVFFESGGNSARLGVSILKETEAMFKRYNLQQYLESDKLAAELYCLQRDYNFSRSGVESAKEGVKRAEKYSNELKAKLDEVKTAYRERGVRIRAEVIVTVNPEVYGTDYEGSEDWVIDSVLKEDDLFLRSTNTGPYIGDIEFLNVQKMIGGEFDVED